MHRVIRLKAAGRADLGATVSLERTAERFFPETSLLDGLSGE
jgi:hypothetical protein